MYMCMRFGYFKNPNSIPRPNNQDIRLTTRTTMFNIIFDVFNIENVEYLPARQRYSHKVN